MNKQQCEIALIILLISMMYFQSNTINRFSKSFLGKLSSIVVIIWLTKKSKNAGIIAAFIMVVNLYNAYNHHEGLKSEKKKKRNAAKGAAKKKKPQQKKGRLEADREIKIKANLNRIAFTGMHGGEQFNAVQRPQKHT